MRPSGRSLLVTAHMTHVHGRDDIDHSHGASTRTQIMPRMYHINIFRVLPTDATPHIAHRPPAHRAIGDDVPGYDIHRVLTDPFPHVAGLDGPLHGLPTLCVSDALLRCCDCMVRGTSTMARQGDSIVLLAGWIHGRLDECKPVISS